MKRREGLLKRVISIYANYKTEVVVMLSLIFLGQGLGLLFPYLFGRMTNSIIKLDNIWNSISLAIVCFALIGVLHLIGYFRSIYNMKHLIFPVRQFVRMQAVDRYLNFSIGQIRNHHSGVSKDVMASGEESLVNLARLAVMNFIPVIAKVAVTLVVLLWLYFQLGLITLGGILVYTLLMWKIRKKYIPLIDKARDMVIETGRHKSEVLSGAPIIISHVKESFMLDAHLKKNIKSNEAAIDSNMFVNKYNNIFSYFLRSIEWIVVIVAIYMVYHKTITFGDLITARMWCGELTGSIDTLGDLYQNALENISQVKRFFTLIDIPPSIKEIDNPIQIDSVVGSIEFKRVSYAYPMNELDKKRNKLVIRDVSFYVNPGEKIAFVGPSSAGKSTLINLMVRADDPEAGAILIDGNNLKSFSLSGIRKHIAVVDQSAPMFDDTLRSNILFGANEVMTDEDLARVCNLAEITFVDKLSHGLDTVIGQNGIKLSGGERQRVAIARALARNPKILILDEATSALDTINEVKIKRALDVASRERTTIIIAHRLSTVLDADRIFVMDNGAIVAVGTHNELLIESPLYQDLVENQMVKI